MSGPAKVSLSLTSVAADEEAPAAAGYRRATLIALLFGIASTSFPSTVLVASLDRIRDDLHSNFSTISWVQVAPSLAFALGVPIFGKLGDLTGGRRIYIAGVAMATVFSLLTALAWNAPSLIALRTLGQLAGAVSGPAGFTVLAATLAGAARAKAIGLYNAVAGISPVIGITVGGPLIDHLGWRMLFLLQAIPAAAATVLAIRYVPQAEPRKGVTFDFLGSATLGAAAIAALFAINRVRVWGVLHPVVVLCAVASPVFLMAFFVVESRVPHPLLPLRYVRRRAFSASLGVSLLVQAALLGSSTITPLMLQRLFGFTVTAAAYVIVIRPISWATGSWLAGRYRSRFTVHTLQTGASTGLATSLVLMVVVGLRHWFPLILPTLFLTGISGGVSNTVVVTSVADAVDTFDVGVASGLSSMVSTMGAATGITILSSIIADARGRSTFEAAYLVAAMIAAASIPIALLLRRPRIDR